jgi:hypothetical protein
MTKRKYDVRTFSAKELIKRFSDETSDVVIASALNTDRRTIRYWRSLDVQINQWSADRYAVKLGMHPSEVWADWFALEAI